MRRPRPCPCGRPLPISRCCGPYLVGRARPKSAEDLMRSRYSAFVRGDLRYLLHTHDPKTATSLDIQELRAWLKRVKWLGLKILEVKEGGIADELGEVFFEARYQEAGWVKVLRERSLFRYFDGRWLYVGPASSP